MTDLKIEVFTSPTCPHCPAAVKATKDVLNENQELKARVEWMEMNTAKSHAKRRARGYGIQSVPTLILTNTKTGEKSGVVGAPSRQKYLKMIYETMGECIPKNKETAKSESSSFVSRFKNLLR